ncbi:hypothetical protein LCGC14_2620790 [marine sediment metagenome]|uniref:Uncharacterized protein n=1 Tax=marine sediment metagenome TaxID=412755 RepID=A0A0F9CE51_9ZZZZ
MKISTGLFSTAYIPNSSIQSIWIAKLGDECAGVDVIITTVDGEKISGMMEIDEPIPDGIDVVHQGVG